MGGSFKAVWGVIGLARCVVVLLLARGHIGTAVGYSFIVWFALLRPMLQSLEGHSSLGWPC